MLILLVLLAPFGCRFELAGGGSRGSGDGGEAGAVQRIELRWLFLSRVISGGGDSGDEGGGEATVAEQKRRIKEMDPGRAFELAYTLHRPAITLAQEVVRRIRIRELSCSVTFGLDDPADTGMLTGFLHAISSTLEHFSTASIRLYPVFHERAFAYHVKGSLDVVVGRLIIPAIRFLCSKPVRMMIAGAVRERVGDTVQSFARNA